MEAATGKNIVETKNTFTACRFAFFNAKTAATAGHTTKLAMTATVTDRAKSWSLPEAKTNARTPARAVKAENGNPAAIAMIADIYTHAVLCWCSLDAGY